MTAAPDFRHDLPPGTMGLAYERRFRAAAEVLGPLRAHYSRRERRWWLDQRVVLRGQVVDAAEKRLAQLRAHERTHP